MYANQHLLNDKHYKVMVQYLNRSLLFRTHRSV